MNNKKIPKQVWYLGLISFFNDVASEMLYPIIPIFLTEVLGAPVVVLGLIEGLAEATASIFKGIFGYWSDKIERRKPFIVGGYISSTIAKVIIALSTGWIGVLFGRIMDRFGKGIRTGARDAMLLELSEKNNKGFIFGLHRAFDTGGAVVGPFIALLLLSIFHNDIRLVLYIAIIPAVIALSFFSLIKEPKLLKLKERKNFKFSLIGLNSQIKKFLLGIAIFSIGNSSDSFLILRGKNLGLSLTAVIGAYILYNLVYALASTPAGKISDKIGQKNVFITGIIIFVFVYLGFAFNKSPLGVWLLFGIYGFYIALTDGVAQAWMGQFIKSEMSGTVYGTVNTVTGMGNLLASIIGGLLWSTINPSSTFIFASICAVISLPIFLSLKKG
jgi:MFS family permease